MNVNKRLRLNIFGYVQALLFSAMLLIFINGEAGWGMIYIIAAGIAASTVAFAASHKHFTVECSSFSGLYRKGDTVKAELVLRAKGFCILPHITVNGDFMGEALYSALRPYRKNVPCGDLHGCGVLRP